MNKILEIINMYRADMTWSDVALTYAIWIGSFLVLWGITLLGA